MNLSRISSALICKKAKFGEGAIQIERASRVGIRSGREKDVGGIHPDRLLPVAEDIFVVVTVNVL
jgi:hypothetical protein